MICGVYAGSYLAIYNGEDVAQKHWTLRCKAVIFDVPEKPIEVSGPDVVPLIWNRLSLLIAGVRCVLTRPLPVVYHRRKLFLRWRQSLI